MTDLLYEDDYVRLWWDDEAADVMSTVNVHRLIEAMLSGELTRQDAELRAARYQELIETYTYGRRD